MWKVTYWAQTLETVILECYNFYEVSQALNNVGVYDYMIVSIERVPVSK